eukprot:8351673-Prorocentrum_lima.AAC.1
MEVIVDGAMHGDKYTVWCALRAPFWDDVVPKLRGEFLTPWAVELPWPLEVVVTDRPLETRRKGPQGG